MMRFSPIITVSFIFGVKDVNSTYYDAKSSIVLLCRCQCIFI